MPKLNKTMAKKAGEAESGFDPFQPGVYHVRLDKVDGTGEGAAGPYWVWEYTVVEPGPAENRKLWNNTTLAEHALFGLNNTFDAFGVDPDTDTDELCGRVIRAQVEVTTIKSGARKGDLTNSVKKMLPKAEDFEYEAPAENGPSEEDIFGD